MSFWNCLLASVALLLACLGDVKHYWKEVPDMKLGWGEDTRLAWTSRFKRIIWLADLIYSALSLYLYCSSFAT